MASWTDMKRKWPSTVVARTSVPDFTGGAVSAASMKQYDSRGEGPKVRQTLGSKVVYPIDSLIEWLETRTKESR